MTKSVLWAIISSSKPVLLGHISTFQKNKNVLLLTHCEIVAFMEPLNRDYDRRALSLHTEGLIFLQENRNEAFLQLAIGDQIWPLYEQLSIFFLFYWPHLDLI